MMIFVFLKIWTKKITMRSLICSISLHITFWKSFVGISVFLHFKITCIDSFVISNEEILWFWDDVYCFWEYLKYENSNLRSLICSISLHITFWKSFVERSVFLHFKITCIDPFVISNEEILWFWDDVYCFLRIFEEWKQ